MRSIGILAVLLFLGMGYAETDYSAAKGIIDSNVSCDKLSNSQLDSIGDYYMEQMHPGNAHIAMDNMMGGEGSQSLTNVHIQMAETLYCNKVDTALTYGGMRAMMPFFVTSAQGEYQYGYGMMGYNGMMGSYWGYNWIFNTILWALVIVALILLIIWLFKNITKK